MEINLYDKGDVVKCSGIFTNEAGTAIDPAVVNFIFRTPDGTDTTYIYGADAQLVRDDIGTYHANVDADQEGRYYWRLYSTGTGKAAADGQFAVKSTPF